MPATYRLSIACYTADHSVWCARVCARRCHVEAAIALPSLASVMRDGVTRQVGLILGKGPALVYPSSRIPTLLLSNCCKFCCVQSHVLIFLFVAAVFGSALSAPKRAEDTELRAKAEGVSRTSSRTASCEEQNGTPAGVSVHDRAEDCGDGIW